MRGNGGLRPAELLRARVLVSAAASDAEPPKPTTSNNASAAAGGQSRDAFAAPGAAPAGVPPTPRIQAPPSALTTRLAAAAAALAAAGGTALARRAPPLPVVLVHGILDCAENMEAVASWVRAELGHDSYVVAVEIGNGYIDSIVRPMEWQLQRLVEEIRADPALAAGFNMIGYSQGSLLARGYVQRFNDPPVRSLISWVGPQAGQFGVPAWEDLLGYLNKITGRMWYAPGVQERVSFANYWRDPNALELYRSKSAYLADLNNERPVKNATYAANMASLDAFVLVASSVDAIIVPRESSWFSFYEPNSTSRLLPLRRTALYRDDWIGLRSLEAAGKLHFASIACGHREAPTEQCRMQIWDAATKRLEPNRQIRCWSSSGECAPAPINPAAGEFFFSEWAQTFASGPGPTILDTRLPF